MKVVKNNDDNQPLTLAELEALRQFEASNQKGQVVFHPQVAAGQVPSSCVVFLEQVGRFPMIILNGPHSVDGGTWWRHEANGIQTPAGNPLEQAWQAAKSVRTALKRELDLNTYVIPAAWFPDMEEDEDILEEVDGRSVRLLFGKVDLVERLVGLPREEELQTQLSRQYIEQEVAALSRGAEPKPEPAGEPEPVNGPAGAMNIGRVETMNVYVTIGNGSVDDGPPLITVRGQ